MPLSPSAERTPLHRRSLDFHGYHREDGLFDIECTLVDTKGMDVPLLGSDRVLPAGEPMHAMSIRLRITADLEVVAVEAVSDATPYDVCPEAAASLQGIVGLKVAAGWSDTIRRRLAGSASCTHLAEMLVAMGTAAYQTIVPHNRMNGRETTGFSLEKKVNSCYAYSEERPLIKRLVPRLKRL